MRFYNGLRDNFLVTGVAGIIGCLGRRGGASAAKKTRPFQPNRRTSPTGGIYV